MKLWRTDQSIFRVILGTIFIGFFAPQFALAQSDLGTIHLTSSPPRGGITGLTWKQRSFQVQTTHRDTTPQIWVKITGNFVRTGWHLLNSKKQAIKLDSKGDFGIWIPLHSETTRLDLLSAASVIDLEKESEIISFPTYNSYLADLPQGGGKRKYSVTAGIGPTLITYQQTGLTKFNETAITGKIAYAYRFDGNRWDFAANFFGNLVAIQSSLSGSSITFYGFNGRLAYIVPGIAEPFRLSLSAGLYYLLAKSSGPVAFGFNNLAGPQFFPTLSYMYDKDNRILGYLKFSPVSDNLSLLKLTNRELAGGVGWSHAISNGHSIAGTLDLSSLHFDAGDGNTLDSTSVSLGASYSY